MNLLHLINGNNYGVFNRQIARKIGLHTTIILSELIDKFEFFQSQGTLVQLKDHQGYWFYLTAECIEERTSLSEKAQRTCIEQLGQMGFIKKTISGLPAKRYFQLNQEKIFEFLLNENNFTSSAKRPNLTSTFVQTSPAKRPAINPYKEPTEEPKEEKKECRASPSVPSSPIKENLEEAMKASRKLLSKIKEIHPNLKEPDIGKWAKEIDLLNRIDKRSWEEIHSMIDWIFDSDFWAKVIQSPKGLRHNWDKMAVQNIKLTNKGTIEKINKAIALEIKGVLERTKEGKLLFLTETYAKNTATNDSIKYNIPTETFEAILCKWFKVNKKD